MGITRISSKGQITIPKKIRDELNLGSGDKVLVELGGQGAMVRPLLKPSEGMKGIGKRTKEKSGNMRAVELVDKMRREDEEEL